MKGWQKDVRVGVAALLALLLSVTPWLVLAGAWIRQYRPPAAEAAGTETRRYVAITFDDGPRLDTTPRLLDGLDERGVHATFFVVGDRVEAGRDILLRMAEEGHQIGLHSDTHKMLTKLNAAGIYREINDLRDRLTELLGPREFMLRPPYGMVNAEVKAQAKGPIILWSVDPEDWSDHNTAREVEQIVSQVEDGDIVLLHDIYSTSVDAALAVVDELMERGFYLVSVEELFAVRGLEPEDGKIYRSLPPEG